MDRGAIITQFRPVVAEHLLIEPETLTEAAGLVALGADSLDVVEITMTAEELFDCEIPDDKIWDNALTFGGMISIIEEAIALRSAAVSSRG